MSLLDSRHALVIGEALVDVVRDVDGRTSEAPGGSPANVALGLGRLGRRVDLLTWLGDDERGDLVHRHLAASGVSVLDGSMSAAATPVATAVLDADGAASYEFELTWGLPPLPDTGADAPTVVHTGSIAAVAAVEGRSVAGLLTDLRRTSTLTYDPNVRPALMGSADVTRPLVEHLVGIVDVVKASDEDLGWLYPGVAPIEVARAWVSRGPALVVVTLGGEGAIAVTAAGEEVAVAASRAQVVDTVGAGDSFMAGLIDGLWGAGLLGAPARERLRAVDARTVERVLGRCAALAAITVSRAGANPPWSAELGVFEEPAASSLDYAFEADIDAATSLLTADESDPWSGA